MGLAVMVAEHIRNTFFARQSGRQPGVLLLALHSTLIPPESLGTSEAVRLISISRPLLNPFASMRDFRQDEDNDVRSARPWLNHDTGGMTSETISLLKDSNQTLCVLLLTVRTWWSTPSPSIAGIMAGTFGCPFALKPWWSPFPTTAVGTLGGPSGDPCVITRQHLRDSTSTSISMEGALQATSPPGSTSKMTTRDS